MITNSFLEKYITQSQEGFITDSFYDDMEAMTKLAYPLMLCLYKYGCFVLTRLLKLKNSNNDFVYTFINYVFYDDEQPSYLSNARKIVNIPNNNTPNKCNGFASRNIIVVYKKIDKKYLPFGRQIRLKIDDEYLSYDDSEALIEEIANKYLNEDTTTYSLSVMSTEPINIKAVLNKFSQPINEINSHLNERVLKDKKSITGTSFKPMLSTLLHEITHVMDKDSASKINYFSGNLENEIINNDSENISNYELISDILYRLWSKTEFNAFQSSYGSQFSLQKRSLKKDIDSPVRTSTKIGRPDNFDDIQYSLDKYITYISKEIKKLENVNEQLFWNNVKLLALKGINSPDFKNRIENMSDKEFKKYFIKTSYKLLDKFKDNTIRKSTQQAQYNKDTQSLARVLRKSIDENISNYNYNKNEDFYFKTTFPFFFKKESYVYPVTLTISADKGTYNFLKTKNFNIYILCSNLNVTLSCKKLKYEQKISTDNLIEMKSFVNLYSELLTKQRKTYLDKTAFELSDDIQDILNNI